MEIAVYTDEMSVKPNQISRYQSTRERQSSKQGEQRACKLSCINSADQSVLSFQKEHGSGEGFKDCKHVALQNDVWKIIPS